MGRAWFPEKLRGRAFCLPGSAAKEPWPHGQTRDHLPKRGCFAVPGDQPRTHSNKQIRQIADGIEWFGFNNPVLVDASGGIVAGHGRVEAANLLAIDKVTASPLTCTQRMMRKHT